MNILPMLIALGAGLLVAVNVQIQREALKGAKPVVGAFLSVLSMAIMFWALSPFFVAGSWWDRPGLYWFILAGIAFPSMGQFLQIVSITRIGPALTSAFGSLSPVFAIVPAIIFLGDPFGPQVVWGLLLLTSGLLAAALWRGNLETSWPIWALLIPLAGSAARGFAQPMIKTGMATIPDSYFATMVLATVSTFVLAVILIFKRQVSDLKQVYRRGSSGARIFILTGLINGAAILAISTALKLSSVSVVAPLLAMSPIWALLFGVFVFKNEKLAPVHFVVVAAVAAGVFLIVSR